jgi:hypothetical protein
MRSAWTAKGGRVRMALLAVDLSGPTVNSLRPPPVPAPPSPSASSHRTVGSMMVRAWRNWMVPPSRSRSVHSRHGQDVLGGQPARLAVAAAGDGEVVGDGLDLQRGELLEPSDADVGLDVVAQQRGVAGHGAGAPVGADMRQPAVQVLVDGELGRVKEEAVAAAGQRVGQGGLGLGAGGVAAQGLKATLICTSGHAHY